MRLEALYDDNDIRGGDPLDGRRRNRRRVRGRRIDGTNGMLNQLRTVNAYISSFVTTDARDDAAQAELSGLQKDQARLGKLRTRLDAYVARFDTEALVNASTVAADHAFPLERAALRADAPDDRARRGAGVSDMASPAARRGTGCTAT